MSKETKRNKFLLAFLMLGSFSIFVLSPYGATFYNANLVAGFKFEKYRISDACKPACRSVFEAGIKDLIKPGVSRGNVDNILVLQAGAQVKVYGSGKTVYSYEAHTGVFTTSDWIVVVYYDSEDTVISVETHMGQTSF